MSLQSSVNLGQLWILITLKIQSNSSWLLKDLKVTCTLIVVVVVVVKFFVLKE